jgi:hypothetical protein
MTPREGQIGRVGVEIMPTAGAMMLRVGEVEFVGSPGHQVTQVVQEAFDAPQAIGSSAASGALTAFVVSATWDAFGLGQVLDTSDALGLVAKVFTGSGHGDVLQVILSVPGYIGQCPSSRSKKLCNDATVSQCERKADGLQAPEGSSPGHVRARAQDTTGV